MATFLDKHNIKYKREYTFEGCISPKGSRLRFDFFIEGHNLCIEFQGQHHFKPVNKYNKAKIVHNRTVKHDQIKKEYLIKNDIALLEIPYWEYDNIESTLKNKLKV